MFTRQRLLIGILLILAASGVGALTAGNQNIASSNDEEITIERGGELPEEAEIPLIPNTSCEGNNQNNNFLDNVLMGGPMVGISWVPTHSVTITRIEVFTGETTGPIALAIWSDDGGNPSRPLANLGNTNYVSISTVNTWQGADLINPVIVNVGTKYWVIFDPNGGEQSPVTGNPNDIQQTYWGSGTGNVTGGASWFGPFSFPDRRWKFRMFCGEAKLSHFLCYKIEKHGKFEKRDVLIRNQFGEQTFTVLEPDTLCVPSTKEEIDHK